MSGVSNALVKAILEQLATDTVLFHACPYIGIIVVNNLRMKNEKFFAVYSSGIYKTEITLNDKVEGKIVLLTAEAMITSPNKLG